MEASFVSVLGSAIRSFTSWSFHDCTAFTISDVYAYVHDDLTRSTCSRRLITHDLCLTSSFRRSTSYSLSRRPFRSNYITCFVLSCPGGPHRLIFSYPYPREAMPDEGHMSIPPGKDRQIPPDTGAVWTSSATSKFSKPFVQSPYIWTRICLQF